MTIDMFDNLSEKNFNPMNDIIFKFIFGKEERKDITIDFLNTVLAESLEHDIKDIFFSQSELSPINFTDKLTRLDVACVLNSGEQVDVEVQVINQQNITKRTLYYWAQMYLMSLKQGQVYQDLKPAFTINILHFAILPQSEPHSMYSIYNSKTFDRLNNDMELHFLEIPKFANAPKKPVCELTKMERWLAYFAGKLNDSEKEELIMTDAAIKSAMEAAKIFFNDTAERREYINREMATMDYKSSILAARNEGENSSSIATALAMLKDKEPLTKIVKYSRLTSDAIKELAIKNNLPLT